MYNTPYDRAECIINGSCIIAEQILNKLDFVIGSDLHLSRNEQNHLVCTRVDKLHNLNSDPKKAVKILSSIKTILAEFKTQGNTKQAKDFYLEIIKQKANEQYWGDTEATLFIEHTLGELSLLIDDDNQFSPFTYF